MTTSYTFTGNIKDVVGAGATAVKASIGTNLEDDVALVDLDGQTVHLPQRSPITIAADGTFSVTLIATNSTGINVLGEALRYTLYLGYRDAQGKRRDWNSGPFEITANTDLSAVAGTGITVDVDASAALVGSLVTQAVAPVAESVDTLASQTTPLAASWPIYNYGASYSTLNQAYFAAGEHWSELLAAEVGAGAVTSYGVNGRRALDVALTLLAGGTGMAGITGVIAAGAWPGTAARSGLIVFDGPGNDIMNQAAMNGASITVQAISGTTYLNYLKQTYRAILALMSTATRIENQSHTATSGTWTHDSAAGWPSGGTTCFTTAVGAYAEYSVTPPQRGPLAGKVFVIVDGDIPTGSTYADCTTSVDGGAPSAAVTTHRVTYTGHNGTQVKGVINAIPVTVPVDGAAHTVRITHAGTAGHFLIVDAVLVPSEDPNPILCMGLEHQLGLHANGFDATDLALYIANELKVRVVYKEVVAEFGNAIYVPSTVTSNGLWSGDQIHLNSRGNLQRKNDAVAAVRTIKARLDSRVLAQQPDGDFAVI